MGTQEMGCVYVLTNPYMPGLVKVGRTSKNPAERAAELSKSTGVPGAFEVVFSASTHDTEPSNVEQHIHKQLDLFRINPLREFFMLSKEAAIEIVKRSLKQFGIDNSLDFETSTEGQTEENLYRTEDNSLGHDDGYRWPLNAEKWQWELVLKLRPPVSPTVRGFFDFMKEVVGPDLRKPDSPEYVLGFHGGVIDRYEREERKLDEMD